MRTRTLNRLAAVALLLAVSPIAAPRLLGFPFSTRVGQHRIYSEAPIDPRLADIVRSADARISRSPIGAARPLNQDVYLTDGGWRWRWLAVANAGALAISRPVIEAIVVNRSDQHSDLVDTGASVGGKRSLSGVLTHEMTHGAIRAHFAPFADWRYPAELREGYCDYVAGGGTLSDAEAHALIARGASNRALPYWRGRKKVEAAIAANGGNVDAMFANWR